MAKPSQAGRQFIASLPKNHGHYPRRLTFSLVHTRHIYSCALHVRQLLASRQFCQRQEFDQAMDEFKVRGKALALDASAMDIEWPATRRTIQTGAAGSRSCRWGTFPTRTVACCFQDWLVGMDWIFVLVSSFQCEGWCRNTAALLFKRSPIQLHAGKLALH